MKEIRTKKGGASIFIVVFTIIILSIIVLGFSRLIISEATKTMNTDLSQSAYDSALAGIEDAKIALLKYHACLDQGYSGNKDGNECQKIIYYMQTGIANDDCSTVKNVLAREAPREVENEESEHAVVVQETQDSNQKGNNASMMQAYTCVTIKEDLSDYRTTLNNESRLRIIPIRSYDGSDIKSLQLKWFSDVNAAKVGGTRFCSNSLYQLGRCQTGNGIQNPPIITVRLIQTDETFSLSELSTSYSGDRTDTSELFLVPSTDGGTNKISKDLWGRQADKHENERTKVNCKVGDWYCSVNIEMPKTFNGNEGRHPANTYLLVSIPYGTPETDISLGLYKSGSPKLEDIVDFVGVQARIDSTGRANDLYRRVETRVELVDTYFPYPEFEITMLGGPTNTLTKSFWVTDQCLYVENGDAMRCFNNLENLNLAYP